MPTSTSPRSRTVLATTAAHAGASILDELPHAVVALRPNGTVDEWNAAAARLLGFARAEVIGRALRDLLDEAPWTSALSALPPAFTAPARDGRPIHWRVSPRQAPHAGVLLCGEPPKAAPDIVHLAEVIDSAMDAIISVGDDGAIVLANPAAERMFGYPARDLLGQPLGRLVPAWSDRSAFDRWKCSRSRAGELSGRRADGAEFPIEATSSQPRDVPGRGTTVILRDGSERLATLAAMAAQEERLRQAQKMEAVGRLAGGVAHDFNNMLTAISGYAQLMQARGGLTSAQSAQTGEIIKAAQRAVALTRQLLTFSRKQLLSSTDVHVDGVVEDIASMLDRLIGDDIELVLQLDAGESLVRTDAVQLQQVMLNLAINSRDAMPDGGVLTITTERIASCEDSVVASHGLMTGPGVVLTVADTGHGMDDATRDRAFEPFFTTKDVGRGTGLGLATVYGIVEQSGGVIWIDSVPGRGTRITVALPERARGPAVVHHIADRAQPAPGLGTLLLVEDEDLVRDLALAILADAGYEVLVARDGIEGLELWTAHADRIRAVVTDVVMPSLGGRPMVERLRRDRPALPVLFMTGWAEESQLGADAPGERSTLIQKPFAPHVLVDELSALLGVE